ncbi:MAG: hypothetical protein MUF45_12295 [Spirosomaceae bacterium]|nr:hypothetical protein [Spirosomataceae bacterium]
MKRILLIITILVIRYSGTFAQNPAYSKAMEGLVNEIQATQFGTPLQPLANKMERIAATEKTEWLPNYWVAYCYLMDSYTEKEAAKKDLLLDKADGFMEAIDKLIKDNEEVEILRANLASARMAVSPQDRWQKYGALAGKATGVAKKINADNPRVTLFEAQGLFFTPEAYGGGKQKAKPVLEKALEQFAKFKPASSIHPNWGMTTAQWMLSQI